MAERTERGIMNHLIETCRDGQQGFHAAASHVENGELKSLFEEMAAQRGHIADVLVPHANRLGGENTHEGTGAAALHRRWIDIKSKLRRHDDNAILAEVERGDGFTLHAFQEALEGMLPPDSRDVIQGFYDELREAHGKIAGLNRVRQA